MQRSVTELVEKGLSLTRAANVLGMHHATVHRWKDADKDFADAIRQAESKFILKMTETVSEHAKNDWRAAVELLARRFPGEYSKPENRLAVTQVNVDAKVSGKLGIAELAKKPRFLKGLEKMRERILKERERTELLVDSQKS